MSEKYHDDDECLPRRSEQFISIDPRDRRFRSSSKRRRCRGRGAERGRRTHAAALCIGNAYDGRLFIFGPHSRVKSHKICYDKKIDDRRIGRRRFENRYKTKLYYYALNTLVIHSSGKRALEGDHVHEEEKNVSPLCSARTGHRNNRPSDPSPRVSTANTRAPFKRRSGQ